MQTLSRRQVIATLSTATVSLCPAVLNAAIYGWPDGFGDEMPVGQALTVDVSGGGAVDITALAPGELAVLSRPSSDGQFSGTGNVQYVGVLHRTAEQIAAASGGAATQDERYLVVNMVCPHRGAAIGVSDDPARPFACTRTSSRHGSLFDTAAKGVAGASDESDVLSVPSYTLNVGSTVTIELA
ncbi:MAG: hypothetical protein AAFQ54_05735 [Pseudomonadota bacterium]